MTSEINHELEMAQKRASQIHVATDIVYEFLDLYANNPGKREAIKLEVQKFVAGLINIVHGHDNV